MTHELKTHLQDCAQCMKAQSRVEDFCGTGRELWIDWVHSEMQTPRSPVRRAAASNGE